MRVYLYILVMAGVTYILRMVPFAFFRVQIHSRFLRSVMFYIPYTVIAAMTIPGIFFSTGEMATSLVGTFVAFLLAYMDYPLIVVAMSSALSAFAASMIL